MHIVVLEAVTGNPRSSNGGVGHQNNGHCCIGGIDRETQGFQWLFRTPNQSKPWTLTRNHRAYNGWLGHQNKSTL